MSSGDKRMRFYVKKWFHLDQVRDYFLGYLKNMVEATRRRQFPYSGLFEEVTISSSLADTFSISSPCEGMDDSGHEVTIPLTVLGTTEISERVSFPNEEDVVYSIGMRWNDEMPGSDLVATPPQTAMEDNVRTGSPEYALCEEVAGECDAPDEVSLAISPAALKLVVDSLLLCSTSPINHSGRMVRVWLDNPVSAVDAVAIYNGVVEWDESNNYVSIPYTSIQGPLGQTEPDHPKSMVAADYHVWIKGLTVVPKSVKDLSTDGDYVFIGEVTGAGSGVIPTIFDTSGQTYLSRASGLSTGPIAGTPHSVGTSNAQQVLEDILGWLNDHVNGDADQHPADQVTTDAIAGTPYSFSESFVQTVLQGLTIMFNNLYSAAGGNMVGLQAIDGDPNKLGYSGTTPVGGMLYSYLTDLLGWVNELDAWLSIYARRVRVTRDAAQTCSSGSTAIIFDHEYYDSDDMWAVSPNPTRLVAAHAGYYHVSASMQIGAITTANYAVLIIQHSNGGYTIGENGEGTFPSGARSLSASGDAYFAAGEYCDVRFWHNCSTPTNATYTMASMHCIGN